jgi:hypothetical protein
VTDKPPAPDKMLNIGPKSAAWLRQVGVRTIEDLKALGAMAVFMKVKRAGFRPSLNLLYALAGAEQNRHWTSLSLEEKNALVVEATALSDAVDLAKKRIYPMRDVTPPRAPEAIEEAAPEPTFLDDPGADATDSAEPSAPDRDTET